MLKYITFSAILIALLAGNLLYRHDPFAGIFLTIIYLLYFGRLFGAMALPTFSHFWHRLFGPFLLLAGLIITGTFIYYFFGLTDKMAIILLVLFPVGLIPYCHLFKKKIDEWPSGHLEAVPLIEPNTRPANRWAWLVLLGDGYLFYYLFQHATTEAIRSPWTLVTYKFFLLFFILTFFLIVFIRRTESSVLSLFTIFVHSFLMLSAALIIYQLGYGFDPMIHRAAEDFIARFGAITPKTPYYIGQYVLVVWLAKITALSIGWLDKILLPLLEALILPPLAFIALRHGLNLERQEARLGSILFLLIPFGSMIATTPQDLANFFALTLILFGALYLTTRLIPWWVLLLLTLTTLAIHPLTGLPMVVFLGLLIMFGWRARQTPLEAGRDLLINKPRFAQFDILLIAGGFLIAVFALPAVFVVFVKAQIHLPSLGQLRDLFSALAWPQKRPDQPFSIIFFLIYHYQYLLSLLILIVSAVGGCQLFKQLAKRPLFYLSFISFIIFMINAACLKLALTFPNIIDFEQGQYASRLYHFAFYLLLPLFLYGMIGLLGKGRKFSALTRGRRFSAPAMALLLTASFYLSYPRVDTYAFSRYINTSATDIKIVRQIEEKAAGQDYIVLGNTSFSAAAIQEFGFKKYFYPANGRGGPIFFYALPTGSPLYDYYQKMVYQGATRETMNQAMALTNVREAYLVIHDYWNSFKTAAPQAKQTADEWWEIENGKVLVFRYKR